MEEIKTVGEGCKVGDQTPHQWLMERDRTQWCKTFYRTNSKCDMGVNNHCESFNKYILELRDMPILSCLEDIFGKVMKRVAVKKRIMQRLEDKGVLICPKPIQKMKMYKDWAAFCFPTFNGNMEYQVQSHRGRYVVDMRNRTCVCGSWQLNGIPCQHAIECMKMNNDPPERYMDDCYRVDTCKKAYSFAVRPLNDSSQWIHDDCIELESPIFQQKKRGPIQKKRRKEAWELEKSKKDKRGRSYTVMSKGGSEMTCTVCHERGHNSRFHDKKFGGDDAAGPSAASPQHMEGSPPHMGGSPVDASPQDGERAEGSTFMPTPAFVPPSENPPRMKVTIRRGRARGRGNNGRGRGRHNE